MSSIKNDPKGQKQPHKFRTGFVVAMKQYNNNQDTKSIDEMNILQVLNDYTDLLQQDDGGKHFENILKELGHCNIDTCNKFMRNYRHRTNSSFRQTNKAVTECILDKMHCYVYHSFDIGNRITTKQRMKINDKTTDKNSILVNNVIVNMKKIISMNQKQSIQQTMNKKYNQIMYAETESKYEAKEETKKPQKEKQMYDSGQIFVYGDESSTFDLGIGKVIYPKHSSLKDECIDNSISRIGVDQFNNEYQKAQLHFKTNFRKSKYHYMTLNHLLSLMIYCNYTEYQYHLSKSYRNAQESNHQCFFWIGKWLREVINKFGGNDRAKIYYHGVGQKLHFKYPIIKKHFLYCPLSTTITLEVALNFTNFNNGLIIAFKTEQLKSRCISVAWLSDFTYESEYL
eukprot:208318_1